MTDNNKSDYCPITGRPFFMEIEHPERGLVPTYGGPFDSYTIPEVDDDREFVCERYDHDEGAWVDGCEGTGFYLAREEELAANVGQGRDIEELLTDLRKPGISVADIRRARAALYGDDVVMMFRQPATCNGCGFAWYASYPLGIDTTKLECKKCGSQNSTVALPTTSSGEGREG
jgi:predicted Zn-ribbon and HTH transcriptional regulator